MADHAERSAFLADVLAALHIPPTPWALTFLGRWADWEGCAAQYNPLATERPVPAADLDPAHPLFNDAPGGGVKNYADRDAGVRATAETLALPAYAPVRAALRADRIADRPAVVAAVRTWGTTGFASALADGWTPTGRAVVSRTPPPAALPRAARTAAVEAGTALTAAAVANLVLTTWASSGLTRADLDWHHLPLILLSFVLPLTRELLTRWDRAAVGQSRNIGGS